MVGRGLRSKLVIIMLLLIVLLMTVVLTFLLRGVGAYFVDGFFTRMETAFSDADMLASIRGAANMPDAPQRLSEIVSAYAGLLGVDSVSRTFYILDGDTGQRVAGAEPPGGALIETTPVILLAITGDDLYTGSPSDDFMDAAVAVEGREGRYIVYIRDDRSAQRTLASEIFRRILEAVAIGSGISAALSLILAHTLLGPIRGMTHAAEAMADGDFTRRIPVESEDEIGVLSKTFNTMASQLRENLDELNEAEQTRRRFVANVSHELRTPLTSIRSFAETIADDVEMEEDTRQNFLRVIINESERMTKIVEDLTELSRFDAHSVQLAMGRFSLEKSVRDVYAAVSMQAARRGQSVNISLPPDMPHIFGDRMRIEQVLINIMTNAVKYTPDGGEITVSGGMDKHYAWLTVRDTGIGIPEEDIGKVFERFHRVDKSRSRGTDGVGGTGLGLSIADEIVRRHGGTITVESTLGEGSSFTVRLPVGNAEGAGQ